MFQIVLEEHIQRLSQDAPQELIDEMLKWDGDTIAVNAVQSVQRSFESFAVMDDELIGIAGVVFDGETLYPWFMNTKYALSHPRKLLKNTLVAMHRWHCWGWDMESYVDPDYEQANRWMKWAGWQLVDRVPMGKKNNLFNKYIVESMKWEQPSSVWAQRWLEEHYS